MDRGYLLGYLGEEFADTLNAYEHLWQSVILNGDSSATQKTESLLGEIYRKLYVLHESGETKIEDISIIIHHSLSISCPRRNGGGGACV